MESALEKAGSGFSLHLMQIHVSLTTPKRMKPQTPKPKPENIGTLAIKPWKTIVHTSKPVNPKL